MKRPSLLRGVGFYTPSPIPLFSTKKKLIASELFCASTLWSLATGLMFRHLKRQQAMLFLFPKRQKQVRLHMWCVFRPIDVLFCRQSSVHTAVHASVLSFEIVDVKKNFRPFTQYASPAKDCDAFIELPFKGSASLSIGEVISFHQRPKSI